MWKLHFKTIFNKNSGIKSSINVSIYYHFYGIIRFKDQFKLNFSPFKGLTQSFLNFKKKFYFYNLNFQNFYKLQSRRKKIKEAFFHILKKNFNLEKNLTFKKKLSSNSNPGNSNTYLILIEFLIIILSLIQIANNPF